MAWRDREVGAPAGWLVAVCLLTGYVAWGATYPATAILVKAVPPFLGSGADQVRLFAKGLDMGSVQANVKSYNRALRDLIHAGKAKPSWIVSHQLGLDEAPDGYKHFEEREEGWTKVNLHP